MTPSKIREACRRYRALHESVSAVLLRHDPTKINFDGLTPRDGYDSESSKIIARLAHCSSEPDALEAIFDEFIRSFGAEVAGHMSRYRKPAVEIWQLWQKFSEFSNTR